MRQTYTGTLTPSPAGPDPRLSSPASARNIEPILAIMRQTMPSKGDVAELASGTGEHCVRFAAEFPGLTWRPTDVDAQRLDSIRAWIAASGLENVQPPLMLNVEQPDWPFAPASCAAAVVVNLLHLIGQDVAEKLFAGVSRLLMPGGQWFLYGPFTRDGVFVSDGDRAFHQQLSGQDSAIGYKYTSHVADWAQANGLAIHACHHMPASNLMFVLKKAG